MSAVHYFNITYCCDSDCLFCAANVGIIDHEGYTMTVEEFEQTIRKSNVQSGDRIIISGGEPTVSPYFWRILDVCEKLDCCIDLTTNGHYFADEKNVLKLLKYKSVVIRIPVFGLSKQHNYLVGRENSFEEVITALDHFRKIARLKSITVNVKFLLCKATLNNSETFRYLFNRYGELFEYTLSPILVSRKVILHKEELLLSYTELIARSIDFVDNPLINCDIIPLCVLSSKKRNSILKKQMFNFDKFYNDAFECGSEMDNYNCPSCDGCILNRFCDKFLPSYINYFGTKEIRPFTIKSMD